MSIAKIFIFLINLVDCVIIKHFARIIIYLIFLFMFWEQVILLIYRLVLLIFHITKYKKITVQKNLIQYAIIRKSIYFWRFYYGNSTC